MMFDTNSQSMGLTGIIATVANTTEVVIVTGLLVWFLTVSAPLEHERAAEQREKDRTSRAEEMRRVLDNDNARMQKLWERQGQIRQAIADLTTEVRVYHGRLPNKSLPKGAPKEMVVEP